jgi:glutaredoxin
MCFLCGQRRGYITRSICDYGRFLRRQLEEELVVRQSPASEDVNTEAEEATALEAVTRRQPVKLQQSEKNSYLL